MEQSIDQDKIEYYKKLFLKSSGNEKNSIFETIADKLLNTLDFTVIDFSDNPVKEVHINQIRNKHITLNLSKPVKLYIEKFEGGFSVLQKEISLIIFGSTFRESLNKFQHAFIEKYHSFISGSVNSKLEGDLQLKNFYCSIINHNN